MGKKRYADVEEEIKGALARLKELKNRLIELTDKDAECFEPLSRAYGLPRETQEEKAHKERVLEKALYEASIVPLELMETIIEVMECLKLLEEKGSRLAVSDAGVGILFAQAALNGASLNVFINTKLMKDREKAQKLNGRADDLIQEGAAFHTLFLLSDGQLSGILTGNACLSQFFLIVGTPERRESHSICIDEKEGPAQSRETGVTCERLGG